MNVGSPLWSPIGNALLQEVYNLRLHPNEKAKYASPWDVLGAGYYYALPGGHKFGPTGGYTPGSANFAGRSIFGLLPNQKRQYYVYIDNGRGGSIKVPIPWSMRPGGQAVLGMAGILSRVAGLPLERSAYTGKPWISEITNATTHANNPFMRAVLHPATAK